MKNIKKKHESESCSQNNPSEDEKQISGVIGYEKWRDDGKAEHKRRDIENKIKKQNARKNANKIKKLKDKK
ncbi:MAG: hypothetical protein FWF38_02595 [Spirochaetaceae bacterium]|nr:hypothetical protein [Spirochaetaceae bacterium]